MANLDSSKKDIRRTERRKVFNNRLRVRVKRAVKAFNGAITSGNKDDAKTLYSKVQKNLDKAAKKFVIKQGTVARRKSRLGKKLNRLLVGNE